MSALTYIRDLFRPIRTPRGSALPGVMIFAVITFITVSAYLFTQIALARPSLRKPQDLQALLNARSGIWYALDYIRDSTATDTLKTINTLDSLFGQDLFEEQTGNNGAIGTGDWYEAFPLHVSPYTATGFDHCNVSVANDGGFVRLSSWGQFRSEERVVEVELGSRCVNAADTLLYLPNPDLPLQGNGLLMGRIGTFNPREEVKSTELTRVISVYTEELLLDSTFGLVEAPLTIHDNEDFASIPNMVKGPLFIDGSFRELEWKTDRTVRVMGDLQLTGTSVIEGATFLVSGDIKVLDRTQLRDVSLFCTANVFIGDDAVYRGDILALKSITVYGNARVEEKSTLVVAGRNRRSAKKVLEAAELETELPEKRKGVSAKKSTEVKKSRDLMPLYSIQLAEFAIVDATVIALRDPGGIKTGPGVVVRGVLYAQGTLCHNGELFGTAKATSIVDCRDPESLQTNVIVGTIRPMESVVGYRFPMFIGKPIILSWRER